ncbi:GxxExxY protein [Brevundimonas sp.]|uniref:GxxExxY protein n=1 Tax=Brevundimonas sp. TaxID=1871086 RepID=UPI003D1300B1
MIVEVKAIDALASIHTAQVLTYLRFSGVRLGYLVNFNSVLLKNGLRRLVL